jgi:hypothetical protein
MGIIKAVTMFMIQSQVSIPELHQLLRSIIDLRPNVGLRFRLLGELWQTGFVRVVHLEENAATFYDERSDRNLLVSDIKLFMQFELDSQFQQFEPHFHYSIENPITAKG